MTLFQYETFAAQVDQQTMPTIEHWHPPLSGTLNLRIDRNGNWWHEGAAIQRLALVRLFASVLRQEEDGHYYLVTPVEKWRIQVEDAPFVAVALEVEGKDTAQQLHFLSNLGEKVTAGPEHSLRSNITDNGEPRPYIHIRSRLWALLTRAVYLELAEQAVVRSSNGIAVYGVWSKNVFFPLERAESPD